MAPSRAFDQRNDLRARKCAQHRGRRGQIIEPDLIAILSREQDGELLPRLQLRGQDVAGTRGVNLARQLCRVLHGKRGRGWADHICAHCGQVWTDRNSPPTYRVADAAIIPRRIEEERVAAGRFWRSVEAGDGRGTDAGWHGIGRRRRISGRR